MTKLSSCKIFTESYELTIVNSISLVYNAHCVCVIYSHNDSFAEGMYILCRVEYSKAS